MLKKGAAGFGGYPKLFGPRWCVVTLKAPIELAGGDRLQLAMHQNASVTGGLSNHLRSFSWELSQAPIWDVKSNEVVIGEKGSCAQQYAKQRELASQFAEQLAAFQGVNVPVVRQRPAAAKRPTRQFIRGNWLDRGDLVSPGIPRVFGVDGEDLAVEDRLEFARWLVSDANPLAARVWANRIWAELFGVGIVETLEDFGASGLPPTHPELLDHLAIAVQQDYAWHLKPFLRSIVLSATYRQDSRATAELMQRDPPNRLLSRGPRTRLTAEMLRDSVLVASDKLQRQIGGPSVMPPQPDGVWQQVYSGARWETASGEQRFRRGLYTYWKRTSPYPAMIAFDAPSRDVCSPRRIDTNTPLQALVTLNSEVYLELAAALVHRVEQELPADATVQNAIARMFILVASREPASNDMATLELLYRNLGGPSRWRLPSGLVANEGSDNTNIGDDAGSDAMTSVALAILNSDWALTK
jgi:hypothetical protein